MDIVYFIVESLFMFGCCSIIFIHQLLY